MAIVKVTAPADVIGVRYGNIEIRFGADGTAMMPSFFAKHLRDRGFTTEQDLSQLDPARDLVPHEAIRLIEAYQGGNAPGDIANAAYLAAARSLLAAPPPISVGRNQVVNVSVSYVASPIAPPVLTPLGPTVPPAPKAAVKSPRPGAKRNG